MIDRSCCFTGHRELPEEQKKQIEKQLDREIVKLIESGYRYFYAGGALGFDTVAAKAVLGLRKRYLHIELILVLPCISQSKGWAEKDKATYEDIKMKADKVIYTSQDYVRGCMHKRNRYLVDNSSTCICYLSKFSGGTLYTVNYAKKHCKTVINIADDI